MRSHEHHEPARASAVESWVTLRRSLGAALVERGLAGLAGAASLHPRAWPSRHGVRRLRSLRYRDERPDDPRDAAAHELDVYLPPERFRGPRPAVLYLHGGGFRILSKDTHWLMGLAFARRGYVVFNANYRLAPRNPFPAALEDAAAALRWVGSHARTFGADPTRVVVAGESAGANLALALAVARSYPRAEPYAVAAREAPVELVAALPACGLLQVSDWQRLERSRALPTLVRDRVREVHDAYLPPVVAGAGASATHDRTMADPLCVLEREPPALRALPPMFAPVGTRDPLLDDSRRLARALARYETPCEAPVYPGELHAFHAFIWRPQAQACWRAMLDFSDRWARP